jgi:hypoxanthine-guanine phosphoribosyltransferase
LAKRVLKIDTLALPDHSYLDEQDTCYYAGEYTAGEGHAYSETNQLVLNFKKGVDKRGTAQWQYKERAIQQAAQILRTAIKADAEVTFVPVPPSKAKGDPLYDDRIVRLLQATCAGRHTDIRELIIQRQSTEAAHQSTMRPSPDELAALYSLDESVAAPSPKTIFVVDDVLTTGCHFKAIKNILGTRFPEARIIGLFIARRVPRSIASEFDDLK